jgi:selenocysteine lyase/cysteine desulfurase
MPDEEKLAAVREALPAVGAGIYLNTGSLGPIPAESAAAVQEYEAHDLRVGRAHPDDMEAGFERMAEARAGVAAILGADVGSVALNHATTDGMNTATWAVDWRARDPGPIRGGVELCRHRRGRRR